MTIVSQENPQAFSQFDRAALHMPGLMIFASIHVPKHEARSARRNVLPSRAAGSVSGCSTCPTYMGVGQHRPVHLRAVATEGDRSKPTARVSRGARQAVRLWRRLMVYTP